VIRVDLSLDNRMCITRLEVHGHALKEEQGLSVPCAAVSALAGTAARLIETDKRIDLDGNAAVQGDLDFCIVKVSDDRVEWLRGITDFLVLGLKQVEMEYPRDCSVMMKIQEDYRYGT